MDLSGILNYLVGFAIMAGIYGVFALGLNVHWGYTGILNAGIAGFFAVGAYTAALLTTQPPDPLLFEDFKFGGNLAQMGFLRLGIDLWFFVSLGAAGVAAGILAWLMGFLTLRLRSDYLAIAMVGVAETVRLIFLNEQWLANGSKGLYRIPGFLSEWVTPEFHDYLYLATVLIILALLFMVSELALRSPWGRVLRSIREDETAAEASGKNVFRFKVQAFVMGAVIMGIGGALFAHNVRFVSPLTFSPLLATFVIWAMLIVGGSGNNRGAILGAFVVWGIWSGTQFMPGIFSDANFRFFMIGVLIVAVFVIRPGGILGPDRRIARLGASSQPPPTAGPSGSKGAG